MMVMLRGGHRGIAAGIDVIEKGGRLRRHLH
jgi:hypothetical protein